MLSFQDTLKLLPDHLIASDVVLTSEDLFILVQKLVVAVLIGALIGLEREHSRPQGEKTFAGIRTFPLICILGFSAAMIASFTSVWVYVFIFIGFALLISTSYVFSALEGRYGGTSEISTFLAFLLGSLVYWNYIILAAIIGVTIVLFLSLKIQLHTFVGKVSGEDIYATIKLAIITVIILPLLPDKTYGPFDILNPRLIWYMVIFISGISFVGYVFIKLLGKEKGLSITGLMGGLVSSTAVTFSLSKKSKDNQSLAGNCAIGILLASTVMYPRVFIVASVLNTSLALELLLPLAIFTITGLIVSKFMMGKVSTNKFEEIDIKNPFELKSALLFGLVFGLVIFISKAAEFYLGVEGVYAASAAAGITSVDAIVLTLANMAKHGLSESAAVIGIIIALVSNTIVKGLITIFFGNKELSKYALKGLGVLAVVSILYIGILFLV
jgi:uncharacterized membrane protein (DUF4010 family)